MLGGIYSDMQHGRKKVLLVHNSFIFGGGRGEGKSTHHSSCLCLPGRAPSHTAHTARVNEQLLSTAISRCKNRVRSPNRGKPNTAKAEQCTRLAQEDPAADHARTGCARYGDTHIAELY